MENKRCKDCREVKALDSFGISKRRKDGSPLYRTKCKSCLAKTARDKRVRVPKINPNITRPGFRKCSKCGIEKTDKNFPIHSFYKNKPVYRNRCFDCQALYQKEYRKKNDKTLKEKQKKYREKNEETLKEKNRDYYYLKRHDNDWVTKENDRKKEWKKNNPDKVKKWALENKDKTNTRRRELYKEAPERFKKNRIKWESKNKEKKKEINKLYKKNNKEKVNKYTREYAQNNPLERLKRRVRARTYGAIKKQGWRKKTKTYEVLKCEWSELKMHIENQFDKDMSWENMGEWDIDHRIPLASAKNEFELIALGHYLNLQPMWSSENSSKQDKYSELERKEYLDWYISKYKPL